MTSMSFTTGSLIKHFQLELCQLFLNSVFDIASRLTITKLASTDFTGASITSEFVSVGNVTPSVF